MWSIYEIIRERNDQIQEVRNSIRLPIRNNNDYIMIMRLGWERENRNILILNCSSAESNKTHTNTTHKDSRTQNYISSGIQNCKGKGVKRTNHSKCVPINIVRHVIPDQLRRLHVPLFSIDSLVEPWVLLKVFNSILSKQT